MDLTERLKYAAKMAGSGDALAEKAKIPRRTLESYLSGESEPKASRLAEIAKVSGVSGLWLLTGEGDPAAVYNGSWTVIDDKGSHRVFEDHEETANRVDFSSEPVREVRDREDDYVYIPVYNVRAEGGVGTEVAEEDVVDSLAFKRHWVTRELGAGVRDLNLLHVDGQSMEPTLSAGDIILVDRRDSTCQRDGVYVLRMDNALLVKRVQRMPKGVLRISSDNAKYSAFEITLESMTDFSVIGRVVWAGKRM